MKIVAELVCIRQEWNANTNEDRNSVIFEFAGVRVEVPVEEEEVKAIIREARKEVLDRPVPTIKGSDFDNILGPVEGGLEDGEEEYGGTWEPTQNHTIFMDEPHADPELSPTAQRLNNVVEKRLQDPTARRQQQKLAMRKRAGQIPGRTVAKDSMGYPVVPSAQPYVSHDQPTILVRPQVAGPTGDDDGFGQG